MKNNREFHTFRGYQKLNLDKKSLTPSMEDYLEMIYRICKEQGYIRIKELSYKLNVRPSSTTKIVQKLGALGLVDYERYGVIKLTEKGIEIGQFLLDRHKIIEQFFENLGISKNLLKDTEMIEHGISLSTLENMYLWNEFLSKNSYVIKEYENFKRSFNMDFNLDTDSKL